MNPYMTSDYARSSSRRGVPPAGITEPSSALKCSPRFLDFVRATSREPRAIALQFHKPGTDLLLVLLVAALLRRSFRDIRVASIASNCVWCIRVSRIGVRIHLPRRLHKLSSAGFAENMAAWLGHHGFGGVGQALFARRAYPRLILGVLGFLFSEVDCYQGVQRVAMRQVLFR